MSIFRKKIHGAFHYEQENVEYTRTGQVTRRISASMEGPLDGSGQSRVLERMITNVHRHSDHMLHIERQEKQQLLDLNISAVATYLEKYKAPKQIEG